VVVERWCRLALAECIKGWLLMAGEELAKSLMHAITAASLIPSIHAGYASSRQAEAEEIAWIGRGN